MRLLTLQSARLISAINWQNAEVTRLTRNVPAGEVDAFILPRAQGAVNVHHSRTWEGIPSLMKNWGIPFRDRIG